MQSFNMHFAQAKRHNDDQVQLQVGYRETLHIKKLIYAKIPIPKDRLAVFTNYLCVIKDQALQETGFTLFHSVVQVLSTH